MLFLMWLGCTNESSINWHKGNFVEALEKSEDRIIMIDFFTDWCVWCKRLDADTFSHPAVVELSKQFVNLKINAEAGEGIDIAKQYRVTGYPAIVFINSNGKEVDRIPGYLPPDQFVIRQQEILNGKNTLIDLQTRFANNPDDIEVAMLLGQKLWNSTQLEEASKIFSTLVNKYPTDLSENLTTARYFLALESLGNGNYEDLSNFIKQYPSSKFIYTAFEQLVRYFGAIKETTKEVELFQEWITKFPTNSSVLNAYAWRMSELEVNLNDALEKVRLAIPLENQNPNNQAQIIDTEAEVLWKLGRKEEAVETIERAITIDPTSAYFQQQKEKFSK